MAVKGVNTKGNSQRGFVVPEDLWQAALSTARVLGVPLSGVLRDALVAFVEENKAALKPARKATTKAPATKAPATKASSTKAPAARKATPATKATRVRTTK